MKTPRSLALSACLALSLLAACDNANSPTEPPIRRGGTLMNSASTSLVECPTDVTQSTSALIGPLGGMLSIGGTSVTIPLGAVLVPTTIILTIPASSYMEVDVHAAGADHYQFLKPISVTVDYSRCTRSDIDKTPLTIWYIDSNTHELLQDMGGTDDKVNRRVTFGTPHLSGYAIAD